MKNTPLRGKYLVKNRYLYSFLKFVDFLSYPFFRTQKSQINRKPKKILISNIAHCGDVIIASSILPILKKKYPETKLGFLCSKASSELIHNNQYINKIHIFDHWKLNRSNMVFFKKFIQYIKTRTKAIKEIKKEKYGIAIDLYYYFPNSIYLLYKTKIPIRIGYESGGFKNYLTHSIPWKNQSIHVVDYNLKLLKFLNISALSSEVFKNPFPIYRGKSDSLTLPKEYILIHIGAGSEKKMWYLDKWKALTQSLVNNDKKIVFTGKGFNENYKINKIINYHDSCINLADKLTLLGLINVIKNAKLVLCVDSLVLHLATALDIPTIVIYCGINNYHHWVAKKQNVFPIIKKILCNPCYLKNGCKTMSCLNQIQINEVLEKVEQIIEKNN